MAAAEIDEISSELSPALTPVLLITHQACSEHLIKGHPEQPKRVGSIVEALVSNFNRDEMSIDYNPPRVTKPQLLRFHTEAHVSKMFNAFEKVEKGKGKNKGVHHIDEDTTVMRATPEACFRSAGSAVHAVDCLLGENPVAKSCFVAVRPPGHHAEPNQAMGFCFFGNAGIAALHAREVYGIKRIAILDWDVHHGNGTQAKFETDPNTFFASSHQMPCYPGTGSPSETGVNGNIVNCALPPGSGSKHFRTAWKDTIVPKLVKFKPQFVIVSAGFDAHADDPLAELRLVDDDFYYVQSLILKVTAGVPLMSMLEGGYNLKAIARSAVQCVRAQVEAFRSDRVDQVADLVAQLDIKDSGTSVSDEGREDIDQSISTDVNVSGEAATSTSSVSAEEASGELLDQIYEGYDTCLSEGVIRSDPLAMLQRVIPGNLSLVIKFDAKHFAAKRPTQLVAVDMDLQFNADKFNFNKANPSETIAKVTTTGLFADKVCKILSLDDINNNVNHPILVNLSPLMRGHGVVPLWCEEGQSQLLHTPQHIAATCEVALQCGSSCRVGFNSLGAFASINHLHVHIMPSVEGFAIEKAPILESILNKSSDMSIDILDWCVPCFSFQGQDYALVAAVVTLLVNIMVDDHIPYNILFTSTSTSSIRVIVIPRQPQEVFDPNIIGFNGAVCELVGLLIANSESMFNELTEANITESLSRHVALELKSAISNIKDKLMTALSEKNII